MSNTDTKNIDDDLVWQWVDHELDHHRSVSLVATGQSMSPSIPSGSRLTLTPYTCIQDELHVGQVVYIPTLRIIHRVIAHYDLWVMIKGDRLMYHDSVHTISMIKAYVSQIELPTEYMYHTNGQNTQTINQKSILSKVHLNCKKALSTYNIHYKCLHHPMNKITILGSYTYTALALSRRFGRSIYKILKQ